MIRDLAQMGLRGRVLTPGVANIIVPAGMMDAILTILGDAGLLTGNIKAGVTLFNVLGKASVVDTADANAIASQILSGLYAYVNGLKITGTMPNNTGDRGVIIAPTRDTDWVHFVPPVGYYSGLAGNTVSASGGGDFVAANIKGGKSIFGLAGKVSVVDTADANAIASQLLAGLYMYVNGLKLTGTMPDFGATAQPSSATAINSTSLYLTSGVTGRVTSGQTSLYATDADFVAANVLAGKNVFGLAGTAKRFASGSGLTDYGPGQASVSTLAFRPSIVEVSCSGITIIFDANISATLAYRPGFASTYASSVGANFFNIGTGSPGNFFSYKAWE